MSAPALYFHTLRYLRPVQIAGRLWYRLYRPQPDTRTAPNRRAVSAQLAELPRHPSALLDRDTFRFLNVERRCDPHGDWNPPGVSHLWLYNLHYFDDLNAADSATRAAWHEPLIEAWIACNAPGSGVGWEPYPLSRRIVNWIKWALRGHALSPSAHSSVAVQARWLTRRLEYHILGNHLLANAKALVYAGLYFSGSEAERWLQGGLQILASQLREQILGDGGHFELSTLYQGVVLEDLLDLVNLMQAYAHTVPADWAAAIARMHRWLGVMTHPDGEIGFFNDAAFGIASRADQLRAYAERLGLEMPVAEVTPLVSLDASGYVRARIGRAYLLCDCGRVGPDHLPGHAHADTLSFELSLGERRVLVNSGTSEYGTSAERQRQRGTAAHNTLVVDGRDSTEVWGGFRVARRARAQLLTATASPLPAIIEGRHDGYRRLPGHNIHRRRWVLDGSSLRIEDSLEGTFRSAEAYFHLHPEIEAAASGEHSVVLEGTGGLRVQMEFAGAVAVEVRSGSWHPLFGVALPNRCVRVRLAGATLTSTLRWSWRP